MLVTYIFYLIFVHLRSIQGLLYGYVANGESIIRIKLNHSSNDFPVETIHSSDGYIQSIALDEKNNILIWADLKKGEIKKSTLTGRNVKTIISSGIGKVTGLDIEWSSGNLYWVDADRKYIEVATTAGEYRKTLIKLEEDDIPTSIVADGIHGNLYWSNVGPNPRVEMSTLSGENQTTLISSQKVMSPIEMVLDYSTHRLYIVDSHERKLFYISVSSVHNHRIQYFILAARYPFGFYYQHLSNLHTAYYLTDYMENALYYYDVGVSKKIYQNPIHNSAIGKIRVTGNQILSNVTSLCLPGKHRCSHLCLKISATESVCACPNGLMKTGSSGCEPQIKDAIVYFTDNGKVLKRFNQFKSQIGFTLDTFSAYLVNPLAVRYRQKDNLIYAINKEYQLASMKIDGYNLKVLTSYIFAKVFAVHQYNDVIFYYDVRNLKIMMSSFDGKYKRTVISSDNVIDMSLYEEMGYVYYINHAGDCIYRVNIDGSRITGITTYVATVLTVDKEDNKIYWFQRSDTSIYKSDLNLQNRQVIFQKTQITSTGFSIIKHFSLIVQPSNIFVHKDRLFISDKYHNTILMANKYFGVPEVIMRKLNQPANIFVREETPSKVTAKKYFIHSSNSRCYKKQQECTSVNISANRISKCPSGFYSSRVSENLCLNCSEGLGGRYVCPCKDWASCAIRAIPSANGCPSSQPYMAFRIRECIKEHRPGHCPYQSEVTCSANSSLCTSDNDCGDDMKCCRQLCGFRCLSASESLDNPCSIDNGGCSDICVATKYSYHCLCPDGIQLQSDKKTCKGSSADPCSTAGCSYGCQVLHGLPVCLCPPDSLLKSIGKTCRVTPCLGYGCSHNCTVTNGQPKCFCKSGEVLKNDAKTCIAKDCSSNLCDNGGTCVSLAPGYYCKCTGSWIGKDCKINLHEKFVHVAIRKTKLFQQISRKTFKEVVAVIHRVYCHFKRCFYDESLSRPVTNGNDFQFGEEDIHVTQQEETDNEIKFSYVVLKPKNNHVRESFLTQSTMKNVLKTVEDYFDSKDGLTLKRIDIVLSPPPPPPPHPTQKNVTAYSIYRIQDSPDSSDSNITKKIGIAIGVLLVVTFMLILICFCRIKPEKLKKGKQPSNNKDASKRSTAIKTKSSDMQENSPNVEFNETNVVDNVLQQQNNRKQRRRTIIKGFSVKRLRKSKNNSGIEMKKKTVTNQLPFF